MLKEWFQGWPVLKGGKGSGFHGHSGRPGQRGGSASEGEFVAASEIGVHIAETALEAGYEDAAIMEELEIAASDYDIVVNDVVTSLPAEHIVGLEVEVDIYANESQFGEYFEPGQNFYERATLSLNASYRDAANADELIAHEIGHHVQTQVLGRDKFARVEEMWNERFKPVESEFWSDYRSGRPFSEIEKNWAGKGVFISFYSALNAGEFFAEAYKAYRYAPKTLESKDSELYTFMTREVFNGKVYG